MNTNEFVHNPLFEIDHGINFLSEENNVPSDSQYYTLERFENKSVLIRNMFYILNCNIGSTNRNLNQLF